MLPVVCVHESVCLCCCPLLLRVCVAVVLCCCGVTVCCCAAVGCVLMLCRCVSVSLCCHSLLLFCNLLLWSCANDCVLLCCYCLLLFCHQTITFCYCLLGRAAGIPPAKTSPFRMTARGCRRKVFVEKSYRMILYINTSQTIEKDTTPLL